MTDFKLEPLTPQEFADRITRFREIYPEAWVTSTWRSPERNAQVNGHPKSKHIYGPLSPIACDLAWNDVASVDVDEVVTVAHTLGLYCIYHDKGSGAHLHTQALPPGPIPQDYLDEHFGR